MTTNATTYPTTLLTNSTTDGVSDFTTTSEELSSTITAWTTPGPDECFIGEIDKAACIGIIVAISVGGLVVVGLCILCGCCLWRRRKSRGDGVQPPTPRPMDTTRVHTDDQGNKYKFDLKGNRVYIPRPSDANQRYHQNPAFTNPVDEPVGIPRPRPSLSPPPLRPIQMVPPPPPKPTAARHINDRNLFDDVEKDAGNADHGLEDYDDVALNRSYQQEEYDPVSPGYGEDYLEPRANVSGVGPEEEYEDMSLAPAVALKPRPPVKPPVKPPIALPPKPHDYGQEYEEPQTQTPRPFRLPPIGPVDHKKQYQQRDHPVITSDYGGTYEDVNEQQMFKGVVDPSDIQLEEYIEDDVYQNEPVLNPHAQSSKKYKNLHMTKGEKIQSELPYLVKR